MNILRGAEEAWKVAKPFQIEDANFAAHNNSVVLGHQTGLGKTFIAQLAWSKWPTANKVLIRGTLSSMATWAKLLRRWSGVQPIFMQGKDDPSWRQFLAVKEGVYMCTYSTYFWLMKGTQGNPRLDLLIDDELHRIMRTRNETWKATKRLEFERYLGLSATWASRGPQDLFPVLNLVNHRTFSSYWRFVETWCYVDRDGPFGTDVYGVRNEANLRKLLWSRYYVSRTWPEVGNQFRTGKNNEDEPVVRRAERVPMGKQQTKLIRDLDKDMIVELNGDMIVTPNSLALLTRKLQMAISPRILLSTADFGGPVDYVVDKIGDDPHAVVFCPFREGLDVLKEALMKDKRSEQDIFMLRGGMHPDEVNKVVDLWKKRRGVMMCTTAFAQSFDLDTTNNAYSLGFDWDPNNNVQAEGRLRRLDSILQTPCNMTYVVPEYSDYEQVLGVLDGKVISTRGYLKWRKDNKVNVHGT